VSGVGTRGDGLGTCIDLLGFVGVGRCMIIWRLDVS